MERIELLDRLRSLRLHSEAFHGRAITSTEPGDGLLEASLAELGVALEELRVVEDEMQAQGSELVAGYQRAVLGRRRAQALFDLAPDAYLVTDVKGTIATANHSAGELLGARPDTLTGKPLAIFLPLADRHAFRSDLARVGAESPVRSLPIRLQRRSGEVIEATARVGPSSHEGRGSPRLLWIVRPDRPDRPDRPEGAGGALPGGLQSEEWEADGGPASTALQHVVTAVTHVVHQDDTAGCGVMLLDQRGTLRWVTVSDERTALLEKAQADLDEGPCLDALRGAELSASADISADPRYPRLAPVAGELGIRGALCAPIHLDERAVGTLNLFLGKPAEWTEHDIEALGSFAGIVGLVLRTRIDLQRQETLADELQRALDHRVLIEQAKGILMSLLGVDSDEAWRLLRDTARRNRRRVADLAREIVHGRVPPLDG